MLPPQHRAHFSLEGVVLGASILVILVLEICDLAAQVFE